MNYLSTSMGRNPFSLQSIMMLKVTVIHMDYSQCLLGLIFLVWFLYYDRKHMQYFTELELKPRHSTLIHLFFPCIAKSFCQECMLSHSHITNVAFTESNKMVQRWMSVQLCTISESGQCCTQIVCVLVLVLHLWIRFSMREAITVTVIYRNNFMLNSCFLLWKTWMHHTHNAPKQSRIFQPHSLFIDWCWKHQQGVF